MTNSADPDHQKPTDLDLFAKTEHVVFSKRRVFKKLYLSLIIRKGIFGIYANIKYLDQLVKAHTLLIRVSATYQQILVIL